MHTELAEGPWWWSHIDGVSPADLRVGLPLRISFERAEASGDEQFEAVPVFRPV
jgi:uncharacterized OB-fold protein